MRIRLPFAGAFIGTSLIAAFVGLSPHTSSTPDPETDPSLPTTPTIPINDKLLHFLLFFILTSIFYFILDTSRRRTLNLTLVTVTGIFGVGSEFLQAFIPNGRAFDLYDIVANVVGSFMALGVCSWYHTRMLERKRVRRGYNTVGTSEDGVDDLELGESLGAQESGELVGDGALAGAAAGGVGGLEAEVDNWDENLDDGWDADETDEHTADEGGLKTPSASSAGEADVGEMPKRRVD